MAARATPDSAGIPSSTPRAIAIDLLAGAVFKLIAEGRAFAAVDLEIRTAEVIP